MEQENSSVPSSMATPESMTCPFATYDVLREEAPVYALAMV